MNSHKSESRLIVTLTNTNIIPRKEEPSLYRSKITEFEQTKDLRNVFQIFKSRDSDLSGGKVYRGFSCRSSFIHTFP